jgi:hypothetical protein
VDRSLRYDPDASPTKNLTASKYDRTADKPIPEQSAQESETVEQIQDSRMSFTAKEEPSKVGGVAGGNASNYPNPFMSSRSTNY